MRHERVNSLPKFPDGPSPCEAQPCHRPAMGIVKLQEPADDEPRQVALCREHIEAARGLDYTDGVTKLLSPKQWARWKAWQDRSRELDEVVSVADDLDVAYALQSIVTVQVPDDDQLIDFRYDDEGLDDDEDLDDAGNLYFALEGVDRARRFYQRVVESPDAVADLARLIVEELHAPELPPDGFVASMQAHVDAWHLMLPYMPGAALRRAANMVDGMGAIMGDMAKAHVPDFDGSDDSFMAIEPDRVTMGPKFREVLARAVGFVAEAEPKLISEGQAATFADAVCEVVNAAGPVATARTHDLVVSLATAMNAIERQLRTRMTAPST